MISGVLVRYVLTAALRDKLILSVIAMTILGVSLSIFSGASAVVEQGQFSLIFMGSGLRIAGLIALVLFVVFFIRRQFDARDIEYLLSRPVSRTTLLLSNACAFSLISMGVAALFSLIVGGMSFYMGQSQGALLWSLGVCAEYILIVNVSLFFSMVLTSPVTAGMATLGFYVLARMMGELLGILESSSFYFPGIELLHYIMNMVAMVIPRLDLMTQSSWLVYGISDVKDVLFIFVQTAVFTALILSAALIDLAKRQF